MRLALILMIKNEAKILQRCLKAVENVVDCFCILDTGSTDNTMEIATEFMKTHIGCVTVEPWQDFGHNRTISFQNAQTYIKDELKWDLGDTYGLLLDADMMFVPGTLKQQTLDKVGYRLIQINGSLEYYNQRIVRMDFPWKCVGVTHEYWDGPNEAFLPKEVCFIDDRNDGGCKHDKYTRDRALLEKGLEDDPKNVRYMFYLAQTYKCMGLWKESIAMYKKRIAAGGWHEEVWYSHYMIGECWKSIGNIGKFEYWMQLAHKYRPCRVESIYKLAEYFRIVGQHHKAYHYTKIGLATPYPKDDVLFIEGDVYREKFAYETTILDYYVHDDKKIGLIDSMLYLLQSNNLYQNVLSNLKFYTTAIPSTMSELKIPDVFGSEFHPSAISVVDYPFANARFVNYRIESNGSYITPNGIVETKNAYVNLETGECVSAFSEPEYPFDSDIRGLEDMRLYKKDNKVYFTSTSYKQFIQDKVAIVAGEYDYKSRSFKDYKGIKSPLDAECEKNWVNITGTDEFIYSWCPLITGKIVGDRFLYNRKHETPPLFSHLRGSSQIIPYDGKWLALVHFVEYCVPRKYYHCFVELNTDFKPLRISLPFYFRDNAIEFCISIRAVGDDIECYPSFNDATPHKVSIDSKNLDWIALSTSSLTMYPQTKKVYWDGGYSKCIPGGAIDTYFSSKTLDGVFIASDGLIEEKEYSRMVSQLGRRTDAITSYSDVSNNKIIISLCTRGLENKNCILSPLDDDTFKYGLKHILSSICSPKWCDRVPTVFWRGGSSGLDRPSIRTQVAKLLYNHPNTDVRITKWGNWENEHDIPEYLFGNRCDVAKHFEHKYIMIIDGNCIASNHQWVFGSGSVPIIVTHPDNNYWFKKFLINMENCILVKYDLSDLKEKIDWLVENDDKAYQIAKNALNFSNIVFTPEFQKYYIDTEITRIMTKNSSFLTTHYTNKCKMPSDINEHLPVLYEYSKKCDRITECGVRFIVSSYAFASGLLGNSNNTFTMIDPYKSEQIDTFLNLCKLEGVNAKFIHSSDLDCDRDETDMLFIDTWHVYGQLKRELTYWHLFVKKYIIMHDTTVDEWAGETIRSGLNPMDQSNESGIPVEEIMRGLWPAIDEFLKEHPEWIIEKRYTHNNGLTILKRI